MNTVESIWFLCVFNCSYKCRLNFPALNDQKDLFTLLWFFIIDINSGSYFHLCSQTDFKKLKIKKKCRFTL